MISDRGSLLSTLGRIGRAVGLATLGRVSPGVQPSWTIPFSTTITLSGYSATVDDAGYSATVDDAGYSASVD